MKWVLETIILYRLRRLGLVVLGRWLLGCTREVAAWLY